MKARLITNPRDEKELTARRQDCCIQACVRGMADYLETLSINSDGRLLKFKAVYDKVPAPEKRAVWPAAAVLSEGECTYEDTQLGSASHSVISDQDARRVTSPADMRVILRITVWATDPVERSALTAMVEDALNPVDWMGGVRLELPYYHMVRADYSVVGCELQEDEALTQQGFRKASFRVQATIPLVKVYGALPEFTPRLQTTVAPDVSLV